jgi:hypothetical protein
VGGLDVSKRSCLTAAGVWGRAGVAGGRTISSGSVSFPSGCVFSPSAAEAPASMPSSPVSRATRLHPATACSRAAASIASAFPASTQAARSTTCSVPSLGSVIVSATPPRGPPPMSATRVRRSVVLVVTSPTRERRGTNARRGGRRMFEGGAWAEGTTLTTQFVAWPLYHNASHPTDCITGRSTAAPHAVRLRRSDRGAGGERACWV